MNREKITDEQVKGAIHLLTTAIAFRLQEKGDGTFASRHEIAGVIVEEYDEMLEALRSNNGTDFRNELIDIAVACVFGVACMDAKKVDW